MTTVIKFPLENSEEQILIEVQKTGGGGLVKASRTRDRAQIANETLETVLRKAKPVAQAIVATLGDLTTQTSAVEIEFGIKLTDDCEAIVSPATNQGNFKVILKWTG